MTSDPWERPEPPSAHPPDPWATSNPGHPLPPKPIYAPASHRKFNLIFVCVSGFALASAILMAQVSGSCSVPFEEQGPQPSVSVPEQFAGDWKGTVRAAGDEKAHWNVELRLRAGRHNGDVLYLEAKCAGTAVPIGLKADRLTVNTDFPEDMSGCDVGDIQIVREGDTVVVTYRDGKDKVTVSGTLGRE
ncbi:hypothetical protein [Actinomadura sp. DC4]|uniref:hypothetical protein n=1 Tax=Actinomadura sp. DC4 TaxID=3055069 RepID=UPI0025B13352|nr:hypothetical protein [Actinomadura sp. DC4]MDN3351328.1 hypothetical protein [Actinomadura sp. DC4]